MKPPPPTAKAVFDEAHEIDSPAERRAYLDEVCADAPDIRRQVEALLRAYEEAGSCFLKPPVYPQDATGPYAPASDGASPSSEVPSDTAPTVPPAELTRADGPGARIGPYRLVKPLGEGGMGAVYLAEQERPIRRQVALKLIKPGMDSAHIVARFEAERQALTLMDHVNIARVYDAGTADSGLPYFVMELVPGVPLTEFCDANKLTPRQRLELFVPVCQAVQHAHQKGIIHRDIKPSNVLVCMKDGKPVPKVIDFGVAKATEQPLTDQSQLTQAGAIIGTPKYMSPEQADVTDQKVDTRTDVYALGVMLYELLTGTTPLDGVKMRGAGLLDLVMRIKKEETPRPSARVADLGDRLATIAEQRKTEPARLVSLLRGELDWIVLRAMAKERERRYQSASDFAKDVRRYLDDEPVEACPPSRHYRMGKFWRKHRALLSVAGGVVFLLALVAVQQTISNARVTNALREEVKAKQRMRGAFSTTDAMLRTLDAQKIALSERERTFLRNLVPVYKEILAEFGEGHESSERLETRLALAAVYSLLDERDEADATYRVAMQECERLADGSDGAKYRKLLAKGNFAMGTYLQQLGRLPEAEDAYRRAIAACERLVADDPTESAYLGDLADDYNNLGTVLRDRQELAKAEAALRHVITLREKLALQPGSDGYADHQIKLAGGYHNLGNAIRDQAHPGDALTWYGKAILLLNTTKDHPPGDVQALRNAAGVLRNAHWDRANALGQLGRHAEARQDWQQAIDLDSGAAKDDLRSFLATAEMEEKLKAQAKPAGELLRQAAAVHAQATVAAGRQQEPGLQTQYARRTLELLKQATDAGWFRDPQRVKQLKEDKTFDPFRPLDEFKRLVEGLEAGKGKEAGAPK
jgi:serine/threonine protein kinase